MPAAARARFFSSDSTYNPGQIYFGAIQSSVDATHLLTHAHFLRPAKEPHLADKDCIFLHNPCRPLRASIRAQDQFYLDFWFPSREEKDRCVRWASGLPRPTESGLQFEALLDQLNGTDRYRHMDRSPARPPAQSDRSAHTAPSPARSHGSSCSAIQSRHRRPAPDSAG